MIVVRVGITVLSASECNALLFVSRVCKSYVIEAKTKQQREWGKQLNIGRITTSKPTVVLSNRRTIAIILSFCMRSVAPYN